MLIKCFPSDWSPEAASSIEAILNFINEKSEPIMLVLPPNISPAAIATVAAMQFLTQTSAPPKPHAKIALIPGRYFLKDLESTTFKLSHLNQALAASRRVSTFKQPSPSAQKVSKRSYSSPEELVAFHWIWKCSRVWATIYNQPQFDEISPREHYGRGDKYDSTIDLIESEGLARNSVKGREYDLMIYCPFYHRIGPVDWNETFGHVLQSINSFKAKRKIIIVRSSYDFWARKIEEKIRIKGYTCVIPRNTSSETQEGVELVVVDQCIDIEESLILNKLIQRNWVEGKIEDGKVFYDLRQALRRALISLNQLHQKDAVILANEIEQYFKIMNMDLVPRGKEVTEKIITWLRTTPRNTKLEKIFEKASGHKIELWVTRESDRKDIADECAKRNIQVLISITDRRMRFLANSMTDTKRVLSRMDRESDLDWVSHLASGDVLIISAWEAVLRSGNIDKLWERSATWRNNSESIGAISGKLAKNNDPVLSIADQIIELTKNRTPKETIAVTAVEESFWWDEALESSTANLVSRASFATDLNGIPCVEIHFNDDTGVFLGCGSDVQVYRDGPDSAEIISIQAIDTKSGDVLILCKDEERGNILDVVMSHMASTPIFGKYAKVVQAWKDSLRAEYHKSNMTVDDLIERIRSHGGQANYLTVRSWVFGPIMAPRDKANVVALAKSLALKVDFNSLEESLGKLRGIPRAIGKLLTQLITERDLDPRKKRELEKMIEDAGVDPEAVRSAVEIRTIKNIVHKNILISSNHTKKLFKTQ